MYQRIHETITVVGVYSGHQFHPKKFKWRNRVYQISEVTLASNVQDGAIKRRLYSVVAGNQVYRLSFNREAETWALEELWVE